MDWIRRGLRFECQPDCGRCCSSNREGVVCLEPSDLERLGELLRLSAHEVFERFARRDEEDGDPVLRLTDRGDCIFLSGARCSVYEARPIQCQTYPFLPVNDYTPLESASTWRRERRFCPGIGKGRLYSKAEIRAIARGRRPAPGFDV